MIWSVPVLLSSVWPPLPCRRITTIAVAGTVIPKPPGEKIRKRNDRTSWEETFPDAVQLKLKAGSAAPFDSRAIHRGLKRLGSVRRSLFLVYGTPAETRDSAMTGWAQDPVYRNPDYLASLPADLRLAVKMTCAVVADSS